MPLVGPSATTFVVGDFDRDGRLDVVSGDDGSGLGSVHLGDGYGSLVERIAVDVGEPNALLLIDLDNDEFPEIVAATDLRLIVIRNDAGTLGGVTHHVVGQRPVDLAAVDLDQDGFVDIVTADRGSDTISVLLNDGAGGFTVPASYAVGADPNAVAVGDFDRDLSPDVCVAHAGSGDVRVFLGDGLGGLVDAGTFDGGGGSLDMEVGDFNSDDFDDIVTGHGSSFTILANDMAGGFVASTRVARGQVRSLAVGDVDANGTTDIVGLATAEAIVHLGDGNGGFDSLAPDSYGLIHRHVELADMRDDGHLDLVIAFDRHPEYGIGIAPGFGTGDFGGETQVSALGALSGAASGDFDGDGTRDVAVASELGVRILLADGQDGFSAPVSLPGIARIDAIVSADFNDDGHLDLAATSAQNGQVAAFLGAGDGSFTLSMLFSDIVMPRGLAAASVNDLDDAHVDLLVADQGSTGIITLVGDGKGGFTRRNGSPASWEPIAVSTGDFDGDGHIDMAVGREYTDFTVKALVRFGNGRGEFPREYWFSATDNANSAVCLDVDRDGFDDVVFLEEFFGEMHVYLSDGKGGFDEPHVIDPPFLTGHLSGGDVNDDGHIDIVAVSSVGRILVWSGRGDGTFEDFVGFATRSQSYFGLVDHFNADNMLDLLAVTENGAMTIHRNRMLDPLRCRSGNVGVGQATQPEAVLLVNGSSGVGGRRSVEARVTDPFEIYMEAPTCTGGGPAPFVLYAWALEPNDSTVRLLPFDLGLICKPVFLTDPKPAKLKKVWNNIGKTGSLGAPTLLSTAAPSVVIDRPNGVGFPVEAFLQGIIADPCAGNGIAATTNGVLMIVD